MSNYLVPALTRAVAQTESRALGGVFRKGFFKNKLNGYQIENVSSAAKRFLVISKSGENSKTSELFENFSQIIRNYTQVFKFTFYNSSKRLLSSSAQPSKSVNKDEKVGSKKKEISYDDLLEFMKGDSKFLFDVREATEVAQTSLLPSATNLPLSKLKNSLNLSEEDFQKEFNMTKPSKSHLIIFYGLANVKGASAVEIAHKMGFTKCRYFPGGYEEWKKKNKN